MEWVARGLGSGTDTRVLERPARSAGQSEEPDASAGSSIPPSEAGASIGQRVVLELVSRGCAAVVHIGRLARGAGWSIGQEIASVFLLPPCKVVLNRAGNVSSRESLAAANETGIELRLTMGRRLRPLPVVGTSVPTSAQDRIPTTTGSELASPPARVNRTMRQLMGGVGSLGILNVPAGSHKKTADAFANLWGRLDEVLMSPCGSGARAEIRQGNYSAGQQKGWIAAGAVCDLLYNASPAGSTFSLAGYAVRVFRKIVNGKLPEAPSQDQLKWFTLHKPGQDGVV
jgi:hypothetical protein